jgi:hypothetical protein
VAGLDSALRVPIGGAASAVATGKKSKLIISRQKWMLFITNYLYKKSTVYPDNG